MFSDFIGIQNPSITDVTFDTSLSHSFVDVVEDLAKRPINKVRGKKNKSVGGRDIWDANGLIL